MINIVIQGICGRMGRMLVELIGAREDCKVVAGIDIAQSSDFFVPVYDSLDKMQGQADVLIDFSMPAATRSTLSYCAAHGFPCVVCTTGLDEQDKALIRTASETAPVFYSANMSLGINLLRELVCRAQKALPGFDIEIVEKHHHNKVDAPSGTALALAEAINQKADGRYEFVYDRHSVRHPRNPNEIGLHAVRGGSIIGEHDVIFAGQDEVLTFSHSAYSRAVFATGAVSAALYIANKPAGLYDMQRMMEEL